MNFVYLLIIGVSFLLTLFSVLFVRRFAIKHKIYDVPEKDKIHKKPIPYLGGLAIYIGFVFSILISIFFLDFDANSLNQLYVILFGGFVLLVAGVLDDLRKIRAIYKFVFEFFIVLVLFGIGLRVTLFSNLFFNFVLIALIVVFIINAFNNIDGMDGLASGIAIICSIFFLVVYLFMGGLIAVVLSLALIGSCLGFLIFNFNPAKIFMGDAGSLFVGFILAVIPFVGFIKTSNVLTAVLVPGLILGYLIFDTTFVISLRIINKKNIFTGDLNHTYNLIYNKIKNTKKTVLLVYLICIALGGVALLLIV